MVVGEIPEFFQFPKRDISTARCRRTIYIFIYKVSMTYYKIIQIVRALWLAIKPFYMSLCKYGFRSSLISYFIKEM